MAGKGIGNKVLHTEAARGSLLLAGVCGEAAEAGGGARVRLLIMCAGIKLSRNEV